MKNPIKYRVSIIGMATTVVLAALITSCQKNTVEPSVSTDHVNQGARLQVSPGNVAIQSVRLSTDQLKQIQATLKGVDPTLYQIEVQAGGKTTGRWGSAAIGDLQKVGAYYSDAFGKTALGNEIITTVGDYIKTIWTAKLLQDIRYKDQIAKVEAILNQATVRNITLQPSKLGTTQFQQIQAVLKGIDPALYQFEIHAGGKTTTRMGSAAITKLQKVGAYYSSGFGQASAANEIITTVSDYIKTIWTADILQQAKYKDQIAKVEAILSQSAVQ